MDNTTFVVVAIVAALALVGVVAVTIVTIPLQQAEGLPGCEKGFPSSAPAINSSKGRCLR